MRRAAPRTRRAHAGHRRALALVDLDAPGPGSALFFHWLWDDPGGVEILTPPAAAGGCVYVAVGGTVYALAGGGPAWSHTVTAADVNAIAIAGNRLFAPAADGNLYTLDASTGTPGWTFHGGTGSLRVPALVKGVVYENSPTDMYELNGSTGGAIWHVTSTQSGLGALAAANGVLYGDYGNGGSDVVALNSATGAELWSFSSPGIVDDRVVANGMLHVPGWSGNGSSGLVALGL